MRLLQRLLLVLLCSYFSVSYGMSEFQGDEASSVGQVSGDDISICDNVAPQGYWAYVLMVPEKMQEYLNAGLRLSNVGQHICPSEGSFSWIWKNSWKLVQRISIALDGEAYPDLKDIMVNSDLTPEEKKIHIDQKIAEKMQAIENNVDNTVWYFQLNDERIGRDIAAALPVGAVVAVGVPVIIVSSLIVADMLLKDTRGYKGIARLMNCIQNVLYASANVVKTTAVTAVTQCVSSCGSGCAEGYNRAFVAHPVESFAIQSLEQGVQYFPAYQFWSEVSRTAYQLPYVGWIKFGREVLVPVSLVLLHTGAQLSTGVVGQETCQVLEAVAANVAYASISTSSSLKVTDYTDQLCHLSKSVFNLFFMASNTPLTMTGWVTARAGAGLICSQCESTVNAVLPFIVLLPLAIHAGAAGQLIPVINISPKLLLGGALVAGDTMAAVQEGHPEYLMIPLMIFSNSLTGWGKVKAIGWGLALLYAPLNYYLGDSARNAWNSFF